ncbi:HAD family hydrolase [Ancylobacter sp. MQZ15Z-1]|uniref:HAD family hydrolase n=1 Tax=Ancylobacter mangrovi TaxID=2972472 RepID=A0A9X2PGE7_9HYPH|nr:HAD family hydrolase [Ancylobacter mangrovi]MCS0497455.1 HAD family hydrolase [Ancylobacter mangrovi]
MGLANGNKRLVLATDLDGTFLGGDDAQRAALYDWIEARRDEVSLVFVTGRDLPFVRALADQGVPRPDFVIGDVGTTIAGGEGIEPVPELELPIAQAWGNASERVRDLLRDEPGLTLQPTPFRYRMSYYYEPATLRPSAREKVEAAGFDCITSADIYFDVLPRGVSKGPTLIRLMEHFAVPRERVLVAGDTLNDLSLFRTPYAGVAVGNSEPALVAQVSGMPNVYLSPRPGAAGIADAIERHGFMTEGAL